MKKIISAAFLFCLSTQLNAQYAGDLYRYSEIKTSGSSRFQALGGNHAALGADASNFSGNPAGLAFYNRSEISLGLNANTLNSNSTYIANSTNKLSSSMPLNSASVVFSKPQSKTGTLRRSTWGIGYSRINDLNNAFSYNGINKKSSMVDYYINRANNLKVTTKEMEENATAAGISGGNDMDISDVTLFYQGFLINPTTANGAPYFRFDENSEINQNGQFTSIGGNTQWNVSYAENYRDKVYWGLSLGLSQINYESNNSFKENNLTPNAFNGFELKENLLVNGAGINASFGMIYKATSNLQLGANVVSPSFTTIRESFKQTLIIDPRKILGEGGSTITPTVTQLATVPDTRTIDFRTPLKLSGGGTFFLNNKKGFITATAEYINYNKMRATINEAYFNPDSYNEDIREEILTDYKSTVNVRIGAEYKISKIKIRAGIANIPNPFRANDNIKRNKIVYSAGLGVRNSNYFLDGGISITSFESAFTPYILNNTADYTSVLNKTKQSILSLTAGRFF